MHVFVLITRSEVGGAQTHVLDLIHHLRHRVRFTLGCGEPGYLSEQAREMGIETVIVPHLQRSISPLADFRCLRALKRILKRYRPDLVHLHSSKAGVIGRLAARSLHIKSLFTAHGWAFTEGNRLLRRNYGLMVEWIMARVGDGIITVSEYDYRLAKKYGVIADHESANNRSWLIQNGVRAVAVAGETRRRGDGMIRLLNTGRLQQQKNHHLLIEAVATIKRDFRLTIVGSGQLQSGLVQLAARHGVAGRVQFVGTQDPAPYLADTDIFVLSSDYEGLPLSVLEAMSAGLPVVATDVGGVSEAVVDGVSGFLVKRRDARALGEKLTQLIDNADLRQQFGHSGRQIYHDKFSAERMCRQTLSVYQTLIGSGS